MWHHIFYDQLHVTPEDQPLLLTENPWNPRDNRKRMAEIIFEAYKIPALYVAVPAVLGLYTSGRLTSIVIDSGHDSSLSIPIYEGHAIPSAIISSEIAGHELTLRLMKLLQDRGHSFVTNAEYELVRVIKEKVCYVALDFEKELQSTEPNPARNSTYELPDGHVADIGKACFECPECLFKPELMHHTYDGIHENCCNSIRRCDRDIHTALSRSMVLSGASTLFPGIVERFTKEVTDAASPLWMIKVTALPQREHSAWMGGSMLASLPTFQKMVISKAEYDEFGPIIVRRKCF